MCSVRVACAVCVWRVQCWCGMRRVRVAGAVSVWHVQCLCGVRSPPIIANQGFHGDDWKALVDGQDGLEKYTCRQQDFFSVKLAW